MCQAYGNSQGRGDVKRYKVSEARKLIESQESEKYLQSDFVTREAIKSAEQDGIVFIDEIDKIVDSGSRYLSGNVSSEGVQRDLLPIIEGCSVATKYGNVQTDHVLFICSGAFHSCKPSDMLAELQGRLPIRVELKRLSAEDFYLILTQPKYNMIRQQQVMVWVLTCCRGEHDHYVRSLLTLKHGVQSQMEISFLCPHCVNL